MLPHDASGGWTPSPRKDSEASARIANATLRDAWTTIGVAAFGTTWRQAIDRLGARPQDWSPEEAWLRELAQHAEGRQTTLGPYHRPWH